jgi:hypothetical protein
MSKSTEINSRIISLNSANALLKNNGTYNSDVLFKLPGLIKKEPDVKQVSFQLIDAQIPVSFYNINYTNNVLNYQISSVNYTITVDVGNYNFNSLATNMKAKFLLNSHTFIITINKQNGIIRFSTASTNFIFVVSSMFSTLGFPLQNQTSSTFILDAIYPLNLLGITKIKISSILFNTYNVDSASNGLSNLISTIPINEPAFGLISYENKSNAKYKLRTDAVDEIDLQLTDQNDNLVNFNNIDWTMTFLLEIVRETQDISTTEMADVLKEQNKILNQIANNVQPPPPSSSSSSSSSDQVEQPINPITTDDLQFFLYSNPNITI